MIDTIYFFASREDICNIFHNIEQGFDIKYCMTRADKKAGEKGMPRMEFDTIEEIADDCHAVHTIQPFYLIAPKNEVMKTYQQALKNRDDIERYCMIYTDNQNSVLLKGMCKHEDLTFDYYVHIDRKMLDSSLYNGQHPCHPAGKVRVDQKVNPATRCSQTLPAIRQGVFVKSHANDTSRIAVTDSRSVYHTYA